MLANVSAQLAPLGDPTSCTLGTKTSKDAYTFYVFIVKRPAVARLYLGRQP